MMKSIWCDQRGRKAEIYLVGLYLAAHAKLPEPDELFNACMISTILKHMPPIATPLEIEIV